jgi:hypothetical protein
MESLSFSLTWEFLNRSGGEAREIAVKQFVVALRVI